jgi:hypothetical protein
MDPISVTIVSALAAGATAVAQGFASEAIKDSYKALKGLILSHFQKAAPFVDAVESDPASTPEQQVLVKQLAQSDTKPDLKQAATQLLDQLNELRNEPRAQAVLDFDKLTAAKKFELSDVVFSGTLLRAKEANFQDDVTIKNLRQYPQNDDSKKK